MFECHTLCVCVCALTGSVAAVASAPLSLWPPFSPTMGEGWHRQTASPTNMFANQNTCHWKPNLMCNSLSAAFHSTSQCMLKPLAGSGQWQLGLVARKPYNGAATLLLLAPSHCCRSSSGFCSLLHHTAAAAAQAFARRSITLLPQQLRLLLLAPSHCCRSSPGFCSLLHHTAAAAAQAFAPCSITLLPQQLRLLLLAPSHCCRSSSGCGHTGEPQGAVGTAAPLLTSLLCSATAGSSPLCDTPDTSCRGQALRQALRQPLTLEGQEAGPAAHLLH